MSANCGRLPVPQCIKTPAYIRVVAMESECSHDSAGHNLCMVATNQCDHQRQNNLSPEIYPSFSLSAGSWFKWDGKPVKKSYTEVGCIRQNVADVAINAVYQETTCHLSILCRKKSEVFWTHNVSRMFGENIQKALQCLCSDREPNYYPLPYTHAPRLYKYYLNDRPPGNTESHLYNISFKPRDDRFLQILSKLIRDQLRIRNDKNNFHVYGLRKNFISRNHPCGKLHPNISYMKHVYDSEQIVDARLAFFHKRSMYYSGWSLEDWWDEKLRAEEKELREKQKQLGDEDKRVVIGNTQQDRLQEVARREMSVIEHLPKWPKRMFKKHLKCAKEMPVLEEKNCVSERIIGHLNMTPVKLKCQVSAEIPQAKEKRVKPADRPKPYLPIILEWKKMDKTTGYPQLKVSDGIAKCGYYTG